MKSKTQHKIASLTIDNKSYSNTTIRGVWTGLLLVAFSMLYLNSLGQDYLKVYTSAPLVMVSDATGTKYTEGFSSFSTPDGSWAPSSNPYVSTNIGTYTQTVGSSSIIQDNIYGAGTGNYLAIQTGASVSLVFENPVGYFGFAWSAGDGENNIKIYRDGQIIGTFNTEDIIDLLPNNSSATIQALNGTYYDTQDYYGKPGNGGNSNEPYSFLHFEATEGLEFDKIEFAMGAGGAFENDNHTILDGTLTVNTSWVELLSVETPTANDDSGTGMPGVPVTIDVLDNDEDGDAPIDPTTVQIAGTNNQGSSLVVPNEGTWSINPTSGDITFTPLTTLVGSPTPIEYFVLDDNNYASNLATVTVTYPTGPTAVDNSTTTPINTPVDIDVLSNDIQGSTPIDPTTVTLTGTAPNPTTEGVFTVNSGTGLVTFTPVSSFIGIATIDYQVCDQNSLCDIATITVNVVSGTNNLFPALGPGTLAFEDLWPGKGDYDFNDLVIDYQFDISTNTSNMVYNIDATFTIRAIGASLENGFGFQLAPAILPEDITVSGYSLKENIITLAGNGTESGQSKATIIVFDNAYQEMTHPGGGIGINTSESAQYVTPVTLVLNIAVKPNTYTYEQLDISNFNPFIFVNLDRTVEVHLPDYPPTDLANTDLFGTANDDSDVGTGKYYKTENNLPWAINIYESFEYPQEKQQIVWAYLKFAAWATSNGGSFEDWYKDLSGYRDDSKIYSPPSK